MTVSPNTVRKSTDLLDRLYVSREDCLKAHFPLVSRVENIELEIKYTRNDLQEIKRNQNIIHDDMEEFKAIWTKAYIDIEALKQGAYKEGIDKLKADLFQYVKSGAKYGAILGAVGAALLAILKAFGLNIPIIPLG